jgi:O-antigen ligase
MLLCAFFLPWGPRLESTIHINLSKMFAVFASLLILHWILCARRKLVAMPPAFTLFLLFFIFHTVVVYTLVFTEWLNPDDTAEIYTASGKQILVEPWISGFSRMALFAFFSYALATYLRKDSQFRMISFAIGAGLLITILLSRSERWISIHPTFIDTRYSAGLNNPNRFGSVAMTVYFLNLATWVGSGHRLRRRVLSGCFILVGLMGCLASGSRGILCSLAIGSIVMLYYVPTLPKKACFIAFIALVFILALSFVPADIYESFESRVNPERLDTSQAAGRFYIWRGYMAQASRYFVTGVGFGRSHKMVTAMLPFPRSTHNEYLEKLVSLGIAGLLLFLWGLQQAWRRLKVCTVQIDNRTMNAIYRGFFISWLTFHLVANNQTSRAWWFSLGMIMAFSLVQKQKILQQTIEHN